MAKTRPEHSSYEHFLPVLLRGGVQILSVRSGVNTSPKQPVYGVGVRWPQSSPAVLFPREVKAGRGDIEAGLQVAFLFVLVSCCEAQVTGCWGTG